MNAAAIPESACDNTHNEVLRMVLEDPSVKSLLDIPCGEGAFSKRLMDRGIEVHSADIVCADKAKNPRFRTANMNEKLPYADGSFSGIVCIDGIEHIERQFDFIRECNRVLATGGFVIISTPNISSLRSRFRWLLTGFHTKCKTPLNENCPHPSYHINMISFPELRYILHSSGFTIRTIASNRIKLVSWIYLLLAPLSFLNTLYWFIKEAKSDDLKTIHRQVFRQMFSVPVLFGETLIVKAVKN
jgi:2-polyprenyl-3-methyl-5-hydroxy-6-metoxy-1,4-benzoquinol methylase